MEGDLDRVLAERLATQGLTSPRFSGAADAVRALVAVQAQDPPLARWSLAMRTGCAGDEDVRAALDSGEIVRTHVLRPTWHFVLAEDLRWLLALTSPKVLRSMAARDRFLGLDDPVLVRRELDGLLRLLAGSPLTRRGIQGALDRDDLRGERLGQLLGRAELDGLICSGPLADGQHSYAVLDERVPPTRAKDRDDAVRELALRFFSGHGPASVAHLVRWTTLTKREVTGAIADLGDRLASIDVGGEELWQDPARPAERGSRSAFLLPVFDEAYLTYPGSNFPRLPDHPWGERGHSFAESGGGVVVSDLRDVGWWKRKETARTTRVTLGLAPSLDADARAQVEAQAEALSTYTGRTLELVLA